MLGSLLNQGRDRTVQNITNRLGGGAGYMNPATWAGHTYDAGNYLGDVRQSLTAPNASLTPDVFNSWSDTSKNALIQSFNNQPNMGAMGRMLNPLSVGHEVNHENLYSTLTGQGNAPAGAGNSVFGQMHNDIAGRQAAQKFARAFDYNNPLQNTKEMYWNTQSPDTRNAYENERRATKDLFKTSVGSRYIRPTIKAAAPAIAGMALGGPLGAAMGVSSGTAGGLVGAGLGGALTGNLKGAAAGALGGFGAAGGGASLGAALGGKGTLLGGTSGLSSAAAKGLGGALLGAAGGGLQGGMRGALTSGLTSGIGAYAGAGGFGSMLGGAAKNADEWINPDLPWLSDGSPANPWLAGTSSAGAGAGNSFLNDVSSSVGSSMDDSFLGSIGGAGGAGNMISTPWENSEFLPWRTAGKAAGVLSGSGAGGILKAAVPLGSLLSGASNLISDGLKYKSIDDALERSLEGQRRAEDIIHPYTEARFEPGDLTQDPGYQFQLEQGMRALDRAASARGNMFSGAALKAAAEYGQGLADKTYNEAFQRWLMQQQHNYGAAQDLAGIYAGQGNTEASAIGAKADTLGSVLSSAGMMFDRFGNFLGDLV